MTPFASTCAYFEQCAQRDWQIDISDAACAQPLPLPAGMTIIGNGCRGADGAIHVFTPAGSSFTSNTCVASQSANIREQNYLPAIGIDGLAGMDPKSFRDSLWFRDLIEASLLVKRAGAYSASVGLTLFLPIDCNGDGKFSQSDDDIAVSSMTLVSWSNDGCGMIRASSYDTRPKGRNTCGWDQFYGYLARAGMLSGTQITKCALSARTDDYTSCEYGAYRTGLEDLPSEARIFSGAQLEGITCGLPVGMALPSALVHLGSESDVGMTREQHLVIEKFGLATTPHRSTFLFDKRSLR